MSLKSSTFLCMKQTVVPVPSRLMNLTEGMTDGVSHVSSNEILNSGALGI